MNQLRQEWLSNTRNDLLAGLVVALALIPEAIAFSIIAGVDPQVGLYASICSAFVSAFMGGRPGMISAATGAMALLMVMLVKTHGLQYLLGATILTGLLQILAGWLHLGTLMRFVSRSVITGFVNALAILIFMAQLPELINVSWVVYAMTAAGLGIIYLFPLLTKSIPSPLAKSCVATTTTTVANITTLELLGLVPRLRIDAQLKVPIDTMIRTATSAAMGMRATQSPKNTTMINSKTPAVRVDKRPRPPDFTLMTDCPIMAQPAIPPMKPEKIFDRP